MGRKGFCGLFHENEICFPCRPFVEYIQLFRIYYPCTPTRYIQGNVFKMKNIKVYIPRRTFILTVIQKLFLHNIRYCDFKVNEL